ncbi:GatB/YqeY domain-containing protein [Anaerosalibacter sp. Marseille-P3206]|uniref:GatB/YqeY domain-containing protein n=1 Tax=Anaerosalibacter sp. Marseille-P3206 TaxID=1871005 RepID=UPI000986107D|nr:GatB/YqeY domain-containing protein [Anaerosalibacter sp. Marseille-P3206]
MSLKEKLMEDLKTSMKNKDTLRKNTITMVRASIKQREVDERIELTDEDIIDIIAKQVKEKRDVIEDFKKGGREDLVEQTNKEMSILLEYLPEQLTEEEIEAIVKETIDEVGAKSMKDIGIIMKNAMPKVKGKADGGMVNNIVRKLLG